MNGTERGPSTSRSSSAADSCMFQEAASASDAVLAQLDQDRAAIAAIGAEVRRLAPRAIVTCARGSSDHAATYAKYLIETRARVLTASAGPSVSSIYGIRQDLRGCLFMAISQSGCSPDLLASAASAKASGAVVLAVCNSSGSPLTAAADLVIELRAGAELSVAATKSFLATLAAIARFVGEWTEDAALKNSVARLPAMMRDSWMLDWTAALEVLYPVNHLFVMGRGLGLGAAQEFALKSKETCGLHAEAFSSAEVRHGPMALLGSGFPALFLAQNDATRPGLESMAGEFAGRGVQVMIAGARSRQRTGENMVFLPALEAPPELGPILLIQSAYRLLAELAVRRGFDPDRPAHLRKITETL